ncbi:MAG: 2Fe-2S iron-sulfur cluster-binding protein [Pseudomonadota bacterium]
MSASPTLQVTVERGRPGARYSETFAVPQHANQTVLDVVTWVQQHADPTLSYRFACRVGMCGSCAMMVNGEPRWTCRTHVNTVLAGDALHLAPLRNLPVITDLVADMAPFFDKWVAADAVHRPTRTRHEPVPEVDPAGPTRRAADAAIECINCAACYAACDTVAGNPDYLGPAALQRAWTLINDERHGAPERTFAAVTGDDGCLNCHSIGSCSERCPVELRPLDALAGLKQQVVRQALGKGLPHA